MEISWTRTAGSALGAVSSAVLLSTLGVAGTLIGAALGSLIITVGGAMYSSTLQATQERVLKASEVRAGQPGARARGSRDTGTGTGRSSQEQASLSEPTEDDPSSGTSWSERLRDLPWKRITGASVAVFVVAMGLILAFELTTGRAVSSYTGGSSPSTGTSVPGFAGRGDSGTDVDPEQQDEVPLDPEQQDEVPLDPEQQDEAPQDPQQQDEVPQEPQQEEAPPQEAPPADPAPQPAPGE